MLTVKAEWTTMTAMGTRSSSRDAAALTIAVNGFLQTLRSANTQAAYGTDLRQFAAWCATNQRLNLLTADADDLARYRAACELAGARPATVARRLSSIASFANYAAKEGLEPALSAGPDIERPTLDPASTTDLLSDADADALLDAADRHGKRDAALVRLLMLDGLKVGETMAANASDIRGRPARTLNLEGRASSSFVLHADTGVAISRYLRSRRDGPLFLREQRGQSGGRLSRFGIDYIIKQVALAAGLDSPVSANALRRRCVMTAHANGADLETIRHHAGHATQHTTRRYLGAK